MLFYAIFKRNNKEIDYFDHIFALLLFKMVQNDIDIVTLYIVTTSSLVTLIHFLWP